MKPVLYRYKDTESVIKVMDGYTPGDGWEPLYSHDQVDQLQAQLVRQQKSYEAEIKVEIDSALERAALECYRWNNAHNAAEAIRALKDES
jgi:hypothetical protein